MNDLTTFDFIVLITLGMAFVFLVGGLVWYLTRVLVEYCKIFDECKDILREINNEM